MSVVFRKCWSNFRLAPSLWEILNPPLLWTRSHRVHKMLFYRQQGNVFTPVCQSFCSQGKAAMMSPLVMDITSPTASPPWTAPPLPPRQHHPRGHHHPLPTASPPWTSPPPPDSIIPVDITTPSRQHHPRGQHQPYGQHHPVDSISPVDSTTPWVAPPCQLLLECFLATRRII